MTPTPQKTPREIAKEIRAAIVHGIFVSKWSSLEVDDEEIKVISEAIQNERTAYNALLEENKKLNARVERYRKWQNHDERDYDALLIETERNALKAEIVTLVELSKINSDEWHEMRDARDTIKSQADGLANKLANKLEEAQVALLKGNHSIAHIEPLLDSIKSALESYRKGK